MSHHGPAWGSEPGRVSEPTTLAPAHLRLVATRRLKGPVTLGCRKGGRKPTDPHLWLIEGSPARLDPDPWPDRCSRPPDDGRREAGLGIRRAVGLGGRETPDRQRPPATRPTDTSTGLVGRRNGKEPLGILERWTSLARALRTRDLRVQEQASAEGPRGALADPGAAPDPPIHPGDDRRSR
jgi:hypothetical protein